MKKSVKKITLSRETLRHLEAVDLSEVYAAASATCYGSCQIPCPYRPFSATTCK
ncbi:MAG TPA: hypothetical protein VGM86_25165 [Thermoanaerobaculia bacterium]|jgi:hypothetical protein